jgi:hypothetical protein
MPELSLDFVAVAYDEHNRIRGFYTKSGDFVDDPCYPRGEAVGASVDWFIPGLVFFTPKDSKT